MKKLCKIQSVPIIQKEIEVGDIIKNSREQYYVWHDGYDAGIVKMDIQQLLLLSDEEIKEGDYICSLGLLSVFKVESIYGHLGFKSYPDVKGNIFYIDYNLHKKIIASYPQLDKLPTFSKEFIEQWVSIPVEEVEVEYEEHYINKTSIFNTYAKINIALELVLTENNEVICNIPCKWSWIDDKRIKTTEGRLENFVKQCVDVVKSKEVQPVGNSDSKETWEKERQMDIDKSIEIITRCRDIHIRWIKAIKDEMKTPEQIEVGGNIEWHQQWIDDYNFVLKTLKLK